MKLRLHVLIIIDAASLTLANTIFTSSPCHRKSIVI